MPAPRIESLLSARLFLAPQLWDNRIYFISNMSGRFSLYAMDYEGGVPEPLLPPDVALQNPELLEGQSFWVFPKLGKVLIALDKDGDENYRPKFIPLNGGFPEEAFPDIPEPQIFTITCHEDTNKVYMLAASQTESMFRSYVGDLATGKAEKIGETQWGGWIGDASDSDDRAVLLEGYTANDNVVFFWERGNEGRSLLFGTPLEQREPGKKEPVSGIDNVNFTESEKGLLLTTALFDDAYGAGYLDLAHPGEIKPVAVRGVSHTGRGEMNGLRHLRGDRYLLQYNIDGSSWAYEGTFDEAALALDVKHVICGQGQLSGGVLEHIHYDKHTDRYVLSFSTAASPTQIYTVEGEDRKTIKPKTRERILGVPESWLSKGEDASFTSYDGLRVSARLYLPSPELNYDGPRPVVYYVHGGPQSQERPNFAWFSMPLIQFFTLNGFAVFVPNVRGSTGYGLDYMKRVDHDWGGQDRLDHVHAMSLLGKDPRLDTSRTGVMGRSYGGYMTLTLIGRHPELWSAAVDMFGPYNLITSVERAPETWKPMFYQVLGHPEKDRDFLLERSPYTYINNIRCPLLVMQGANDPRVIERESRDVVEQLRAAGKTADYIVFEDEGHDVIKYANKVRCYNAIVDFFKTHLRP
jgi:pimeloyl-ACP methyl ester carboxylesterase